MIADNHTIHRQYRKYKNSRLILSLLQEFVSHNSIILGLLKRPSLSANEHKTKLSVCVLICILYVLAQPTLSSTYDLQTSLSEQHCATVFFCFSSAVCSFQRLICCWLPCT